VTQKQESETREAEIFALDPIGPREELVQVAGELLDYATSSVDALRRVGSGNVQGNAWEILRRSIVVRQYEALSAIMQMTGHGSGHFGVVLLRAAYEELVWLDYLSLLPSGQNDICVALVSQEICDSLGAQNEYLGKDGMASIGFSQAYVKKTLAKLRAQNATLKSATAAFEWSKPNHSKEDAKPSFWKASAKTNRDKEYRYLYLATSRFAHFSAHELLRRVWGGEGSWSIASSHFSRYWTDFALYWGARIFLESVNASKLEMSGRFDEETRCKFLERISLMTPVQIITKTEVER